MSEDFPLRPFLPADTMALRDLFAQSIEELTADAIRPAPPMASNGADNGALTGIGSVGDRMLILMDIEALMSSPDMGLLNGAN